MQRAERIYLIENGWSRIIRLIPGRSGREERWYQTELSGRPLTLEAAVASQKVCDEGHMHVITPNPRKGRPQKKGSRHD